MFKDVIRRLTPPSLSLLMVGSACVGSTLVSAAETGSLRELVETPTAKSDSTPLGTEQALVIEVDGPNIGRATALSGPIEPVVLIPSSQQPVTRTLDLPEPMVIQPVGVSDPVFSAGCEPASTACFQAKRRRRQPLAVPNMLGDFAGSQTYIGTRFPLAPAPFDPITSPIAGGRRFKVAQNTGVLPQDRVFTNFNVYQNALENADAVSDDLYRVQLGFEKTLLNELFSVELRLSALDGYDTFQQETDENYVRGTEFGNLHLAFKMAMLRTESFSIGAGLTLSVPTAEDIVFEAPPALARPYVENESVFLAPFIGFVSRPNNDCFFQGFLQADFTLGGDTVVTPTGVEFGPFQEQNLIYASLSAGRWIYQDLCCNALVNGVAVMTELHYTDTLNDTDIADFGADEIFGLDFEYLNSTTGVVVNTGKTNVRVAAALPLLDDDYHKPFDVEWQLSLNRSF
ncbi:MAG: hypothetical protein AAGD07_17530 [Planctomycetota bacterium]